MLPFMQKMSNAAGRKNHRHHFSGFIFSNGKTDDIAGKWRVLSKPRKAKGSVIRYLCNGKSIKEVVLNKKQKSENNRDFINAETGSLASCSNDFKNNRLGKNDNFTL